MKRTLKHAGGTIGLFLAVPGFAFAQCASSFTSLAKLLDYLTCLLSRNVVPLLITVALIMFFVGVIKFIANADDTQKRAEGRESMLWGIVALFVMISIIGILYVLGNTFNVGQGGNLSNITPQLQQP